MSDNSWNFNSNDPNIFYTFNTGYDPNFVYTVNLSSGSFSIGPDLDAIWRKADEEFDAMEDQTSIAKQMLNDIGITWNEE